MNPSRMQWLLPVLFVLAGCGPNGSTPPPSVEQQLLTFCHALSISECSATPMCVVAEVQCPACPPGAVCQPCQETLECTVRPVAPAACETLDANACVARSDCELLTPNGTPTAPPNGNGDQALPAPTCHTRTAPTCSGLSHDACLADANCELQPAACDAACIPDGNGGCVPCAGEVCAPRTRPSPCSGLDVSSCSARTDCHVEYASCDCAGGPEGANCFCDPAPVCVPNTASSCDGYDPNTCATHPECELVQSGCSPCAPGVACFCEPQSVCRARQPQTCESLAPDACAVDPRCQLVDVQCDVYCDPDGQNCPACAGQVCVTRPASTCEGLDANTCSTRADCHLEYADCNCGSGPNGGGEGAPCFCEPAPRCVTNAPSRCAQLDPAVCVADPACELVPVPCACPAGGECACPDAVVCQPRSSSCAGLSDAACTANPACELQTLECAQVCIPDASGNCQPCDPANVCVPRTVTGPCDGLSETECSANPACELEYSACDAVCEPDGQGGCLPCPTRFACVTRTPMDRCNGLPHDACLATPGCELETVQCLIDCAPDQGGTCPPCPPTEVCVQSVPPSPCANLDEQSCSANAACQWVAFACPAICEFDPATGECKPCDAPPASCQERPVEPPVAGCGSGGGQPPMP